MGSYPCWKRLHTFECSTLSYVLSTQYTGFRVVNTYKQIFNVRCCSWNSKYLKDEIHIIDKYTLQCNSFAINECTFKRHIFPTGISGHIQIWNSM